MEKLENGGRLGPLQQNLPPPPQKKKTVRWIRQCRAVSPTTTAAAPPSLCPTLHLCPTPCTTCPSALPCPGTMADHNSKLNHFRSSALSHHFIPADITSHHDKNDGQITSGPNPTRTRMTCWLVQPAGWARQANLVSRAQRQMAGICRNARRTRYNTATAAVLRPSLSPPALPTVWDC